jgi:hypothetical protein
VRGGGGGNSKMGARLSTVCLSMYNIIENIYYPQLSSVTIPLQPEPVSHSYNTKSIVFSLSLSVLSSCRLLLPPTCLLLTANEARSYLYISTIHAYVTYVCYIHTYRPICKHAYIHRHIRTHMHILHTPMFIYALLNTHIHILHAYIHTYIHCIQLSI